MIYQLLYISNQFNKHIGETTGTLLFLILGHNIDWTEKLITFLFSVGAGLFVHILKEINIGKLLLHYFKNDKKNKHTKKP